MPTLASSRTCQANVIHSMRCTPRTSCAAQTGDSCCAKRNTHGRCLVSLASCTRCGRRQCRMLTMWCPHCTSHQGSPFTRPGEALAHASSAVLRCCQPVLPTQRPATACSSSLALKTSPCRYMSLQMHSADHIRGVQSATAPSWSPTQRNQGKGTHAGAAEHELRWPTAPCRSPLVAAACVTGGSSSMCRRGRCKCWW